MVRRSCKYPGHLGLAKAQMEKITGVHRGWKNLEAIVSWDDSVAVSDNKYSSLL